MTAVPLPRAARGYRSAFDNWDERSSVRGRGEREPEPAGDVAQDWLPEVPGISDHPLVRERGRRDAVLAALLVGYLDFTVRLELTTIVPVTSELVMRSLGAEYGAEIVRDALRVQCDEAYHALLCEDLAEEAARFAGIARDRLPEHAFFQRVRELSAQVRGALEPGQFAFCVAVVAETVITDTLSKDRRQAALRSRVREVLDRHYRDEIRHRIFFADALAIIYPQWSPAARAAMGPIWPELVRGFLRFDEVTTTAALAMVGFSPADAARIVADGLAADDQALARGALVDFTLEALVGAGVGARP